MILISRFPLKKCKLIKLPFLLYHIHCNGIALRRQQFINKTNALFEKCKQLKSWELQHLLMLHSLIFWQEWLGAISKHLFICSSGLWLWNGTSFISLNIPLKIFWYNYWNFWITINCRWYKLLTVKFSIHTI